MSRRHTPIRAGVDEGKLVQLSANIRLAARQRNQHVREPRDIPFARANPLAHDHDSALQRANEDIPQDLGGHVFSLHLAAARRAANATSLPHVEKEPDLLFRGAFSVGLVGSYAFAVSRGILDEWLDHLDPTSLVPFITFPASVTTAARSSVIAVATHGSGNDVWRSRTARRNWTRFSRRRAVWRSLEPHKSHHHRLAPNDMEFSGERQRVRCNDGLSDVAPRCRAATEDPS